MKVHNIMEDIVERYVDDILIMKKDQNANNEQYKMDIICYVLNKVKPMYVVSSRGIIHSENEFRNNVQKEIDILSLINEAINVVNKTPRTYDFSKSNENEEIIFNNDFLFVFPNIVCRIISANDFLPIECCKVTLCEGTTDLPLKMINERWQNPLCLVKAMNGTVSFWPKPIKAEANALQKVFNFNIKIEIDNFIATRRFFEIPVISTNKSDYLKIGNQIYRLDDIYIETE